jgi:hypothetical protein
MQAVCQGQRVSKGSLHSRKELKIKDRDSADEETVWLVQLSTNRTVNDGPPGG